MQISEQVQWATKLEKDTYNLGDTIKVIGSFQSIADEPKTWTVHSLVNQIDSDEFPLGIVPISIELSPRQKKEIVIQEIEVTDDLSPGDYSIRLGLELERSVMDFKDLNFSIKGTRKPLDIKVTLSMERGGKNLRVFTSQHKKFFVTVKCDISGLTVSGICIDPKGNEIPLNFKNMIASGSIADEGSFTLKINAEAKGYKLLSKVLTFSVVKDKPVFGGLKSIKEKS